ncbi:VWA domain-containing protein [Reyranella sp. CPCC 100927]|uniref:VWA domain-containing protein n=1 Tax=Reyranella sp. CPCC 100927 TaxID=2599616 RepID=UPI0011B7F997|nr:VWA domain-containing protein [Reyranella sp. CPCC 100927]TWT08795.1 VWA domain-containing protein [Reyranella sp. CPCC 100927]
MNVNTLVSTTIAGARPLGVRGEPLHNAQDQIRGALRRRLGERYARLLAEPQSYDGGRATDWYTAASGPVQRFSSLPAARQKALLAEVDGLLGDIEALARRFGEAESEDGRLLGRALALAVRRPSDDYLFLIGDQPVIVCWGYESDSTGAPVAPVLVPISEKPGTRNGAAARDDDASAAGDRALPVALADGTQRAPRRWWAASAAVVFLAIGTAWAMQGFTGVGTMFDSASSEVPPPPAPAAIAVVEQHVRLSAALTQSRVRGEELGVELASLQEQARRERERCRAPAAPVTPPDEPRGEEARGLGPPAIPTADTTVAAAAPSCPPPRRPGTPAPEVTIILDGSTSMNMPSGLNAAQDDGLVARSRRGDREAAGEIKTLSQTPGPKRLDDAKQAVTTVIPQLPSEVRVGFVVFDDCRAVQDFGFFGAADRSRLIGLIQGKTARGGTPLARAIETAANGLRSPNGTIVVFSDGRDSCGGNICAVAQRLHAAKPGVKIHLIDVVGSADESTCLATITGGKIYSATNAQAALDAFTDATSSVQVPLQCRNTRN